MYVSSRQRINHSVKLYAAETKDDDESESESKSKSDDSPAPAPAPAAAEDEVSRQLAKAKELIEAAKPPQKTRNPSSWKPNRGCWKESAACFLPGSRKNLLKIISEAFASCRVICSAED